MSSKNLILKSVLVSGGGLAGPAIATLLARDGVDVTAFAEYERIVRPYVDVGQKLPPGGIRAYAPQSQRAIWARWMSTRLMASRPLGGLTRRLFFSKAGAIDLPEYASAAVR
jgi:hypothetical protein